MFMHYADDTIWLLFGLGLALVAGPLLFYAVYGQFGWGSFGLLVTGILVTVSYYLVGSHPPRNGSAGHG